MLWNSVKKGADVVVNYRSDETGMQKTVEEIKKMGRQAKAAVYLVSNDASWITSYILTVDGGDSLK